MTRQFLFALGATALIAATPLPYRALVVDGPSLDGQVHDWAHAEALAPRLRCHGALFIGPRSAEVFGDYGVGPNHVLPTGGTARSAAGLSVLTFLRARTWLRLGQVPPALSRDAAALARLEGLEAHARAAEHRAKSELRGSWR